MEITPPQPRFNEGDRVVRNPATWDSLAKYFPDLSHPRSGLGVGTILHFGWNGPSVMGQLPTAALVRWGDEGDPAADHVMVELDHLEQAPDGFVDPRDYSDPDVLWEAFDDASEEVSGSRLTALIDLHLRPIHAARVEDERRRRAAERRTDRSDP